MNAKKIFNKDFEFTLNKSKSNNLTSNYRPLDENNNNVNAKSMNDNKSINNNDLDNCTNNSAIIKLKKKKKKKSKKRRHHHSNESDNDNIELDWVERTKETLEMEKNNSKGGKGYFQLNFLLI